MDFHRGNGEKYQKKSDQWLSGLLDEVGRITEKA